VTRVIPILSIYRVYIQIGSTIMPRIKGHRGTSYTFIFIKHETYKLQYRFRDKGHPYTIYLPNLNPNRFKYYVTHQGTSSNFQFIKHVTI